MTKDRKIFYRVRPNKRVHTVKCFNPGADHLSASVAYRITIAAEDYHKKSGDVSWPIEIVILDSRGKEELGVFKVAPIQTFRYAVEPVK